MRCCNFAICSISKRWQTKTHGLSHNLRISLLLDRLFDYVDTRAGGKVIVASGRGSINGAAIALEGDAIYCPACKSNGKILCIGNFA